METIPITMSSGQSLENCLYVYDIKKKNQSLPVAPRICLDYDGNFSIKSEFNCCYEEFAVWWSIRELGEVPVAKDLIEWTNKMFLELEGN